MHVNVYTDTDTEFNSVFILDATAICFGQVLKGGVDGKGVIHNCLPVDCLSARPDLQPYGGIPSLQVNEGRPNCTPQSLASALFVFARHRAVIPVATQMSVCAPCVAKTCALRPLFGRVVGKLGAAEP